MLRRAQILKGNRFTVCLQILYVAPTKENNLYSFPYSSFVFQALIMGSLFLNVQDATAGYYSRGGILFLYVLKILVPFVLLTSHPVAPSCSPP
jgi:ATP-binding cassette, subfamily G (WHITE), member 2, SNQ2